MDILKDLKSKLEVAVDEVGGSDIEKKVKKATSLENWPATNTQLHELSQASNDYGCFNEIMALLWKRVAEPPKNWRTVYKCLVLLEHLIRFGSQRVVEQARDRQFVLRQLQDFHFRENGDKDRGTGIREKAKLICDLLADARQLEEVRKQASANLHKFVGVSNNGSVSSMGSGVGGGGSRYGGGSSNYDNDRGFGGGGGAFNDNSGNGGGGYDAYVSKKDSAKAAESSPYDDADSGEKKAKKPKKSKKEENEPEESENPYEDASEKKKKKKADKHDDEDEDAAKAAKKAKKALKIKMRDEAISGAAPPMLAAPPADDGFGDFATASFTAAPVATFSATAAYSAAPLSFDSIGSSSTPMRATPAAAPQGDLLDMFASASIDNASSSSNNNWASQGPVDFMTAAPQAQPKIATPALFDTTSTRAQPTRAQPVAAAAPNINIHNNADAFSSFVAGHKPTPAAAPAAAAPKKAAGDAWSNSLINLDGMSSAKPTTGVAPAPFIPMQKSAGSSHDPFGHLGGSQQQQRQMPMQPGGGMQRPMGQMGMGQMGMPGQMGMGGMGQMGMQPSMGMGQMGGMNPMMGGMGMGMGQMNMGMGQMGGKNNMAMGGGNFSSSLAFPTKQADPNAVFF